jgi:hypothetical protein
MSVRDNGWHNSVHLNVEHSPFGSHDTCRHVHPALGSAVPGMSLTSNNTCQGRDIDDLTDSLLYHSGHNNLRQQEGGPEIDGLSLIPLFDRGLDDTLAMKDSRVVHEDVHRSEKLEGLGTRDARPLDPSQIRPDSDATATLTGNSSLRRFQDFRISSHDADIGSHIGEKGRDFRSDTPLSGRDQSPFALHVESTGVVRHWLKSPGVDWKRGNIP